MKKDRDYNKRYIHIYKDNTFFSFSFSKYCIKIALLSSVAFILAVPLPYTACIKTAEAGDSANYYAILDNGITLSDDAAIKSYIKRGKIFYTKKQLDSAKVEFYKVLEIDPENSVAISFLQKIDKEVKQAEREKRQQDAERYLAAAKDLYNSGSYNQARIEFNKVLEIDKENKTAANYIERISELLQKDKEAKLKEEQRKNGELARQEEKRRKEQLDTEKKKQEEAALKEKTAGQIELAKGLFAKGSYDNAEKVFNKVLEVDPQNIVALDYLRRIDERKDQSAIAQKREEAEAQLHKAKVFLVQKKYELAKIEFGVVLELDPENKTAKKYLENIGELIKQERERQRQDELARIEKEQNEDELFEAERRRQEELVKKGELDEQLYKAQRLYVKKQYEQAKAEFNKVLDIEPTNNTAKEYLSRIDDIAASEKEKEEQLTRIKQAKQKADAAKKLFKEKKYDEAKIAFDEIISLDLANKTAKDYLSRLDEMVKKAEKEEQDRIDKERKEQDRIELSKNKEGLSEKEKKELEAEDRRQQELIKLKVLNMLEKGKTLYSKKKYEEAKAEFKEVLVKDPENETAERYINEINKTLGVTESAEGAQVFAKTEEAGGAGAEVRHELSEKKKALIDQLNKAKNLYYDKQYDQAKAEFVKILEADPANDTAKSYIVRIEKDLRGQAQAVEKKKEDEAKREETIQKSKIRDQVIAQMNKAKNLYNKKSHEQAKLAFNEVLKLDPNSKTAKQYIEKINQLAKKEQERTPEERLQEEVVASLNTAKDLYNKKDYDNAKAAFNDVLKIDPRNKTAQKYLGSMDTKSRDVKEKQAKRELSDRLKKAKDLIERKQYEQARFELLEVLRLYPDNQTATKYLRRVDEKVRTLAEEKKKQVEACFEKGVLAIDDCVNVAVQNDIRLTIAKEQLELAQLRLNEAYRALFPSASLKYENTSGVFSIPYRGHKYGIEAEQPIFHGGELVYTVNQAKINLEVTQKDYDKTKNEIILAVKKAYYSLVKAKENLKYQEELFAQVDPLVKMTEKAYESQVSTKLEFLNINSLYNQVQFQVASAQDDISISRLILNQAMGVDPNKEFDINTKMQFKKIDINLDECMKLAFENRSELLISNLLIKYYDFEKKIASTKGLKVDLAGSIGEGGEYYQGQSVQMDKEWFLGLKVNVPFWGNTLKYNYTKDVTAPTISAYKGAESIMHTLKFSILDGLKQVSGAKEADILYMQAEWELQKMERDVTLEVRETFYNYRKFVLQIESALSKIAFQENEVALTKAKMELGESFASEYIESLVKLAQERYSYTEALSGYHTVIAELNKVIGVDGFFQIAY